MYIVSRCLLCDNCKYDGGNNYNEDVVEFCKTHSYVAVCPEGAAWLPTPREPAEIVDNNPATFKVVDKKKVVELGVANRAFSVIDATGENVFDGNGADPGISMGPTNVAYDQEVELPSNRFVRVGYEFAGWSYGAEKYNDGGVVTNLTTTAGATGTLSAGWAESGNPLVIALDLPRDFKVSASPADAWTIIDEAKEKKGLQRTADSSKDGALILKIPSAGTLSFDMDIQIKDEAEFYWKFNNDDIEDNHGDISIVQSKTRRETFEFDTKGDFAIYGNPESGKTWKVSDFHWE